MEIIRKEREGGRERGRVQDDGGEERKGEKNWKGGREFGLE